MHTRVQNLSWSHLRALLRIPDEDARVWYMNEAVNIYDNWWTIQPNCGIILIISTPPVKRGVILRVVFADE